MKTIHTDNKFNREDCLTQLSFFDFDLKIVLTSLQKLILAKMLSHKLVNWGNAQGFS